MILIQKMSLGTFFDTNSSLGASVHAWGPYMLTRSPERSSILLSKVGFMWAFWTLWAGMAENLSISLSVPVLVESPWQWRTQDGSTSKWWKTKFLASIQLCLLLSVSCRLFQFQFTSMFWQSILIFRFDYLRLQLHLWIFHPSGFCALVPPALASVSDSLEIKRTTVIISLPEWAKTRHCFNCVFLRRDFILF